MKKIRNRLAFGSLFTALVFAACSGEGDSVVTNGGICGTIVGIDEKTVVLRISENPPVKVEFLRQAVSRAVSPDNADQQNK